VSHEALLFDYERPLTRDADLGRFAGSAHTVWVGDRTRSTDGAHAAFAGSISNPVGVKLGPTISPPEAVRLSHVLNPNGLHGHLAFIVRLGSERIRCLLPELVGEVARRGSPVVWLCDPMHGNTRQVRGDLKTRPLEAILEEVVAFVRVMQGLGQWPGGLHLEMTPDDVTECVSVERGVRGLPRPSRYRSACDPRLNPGQAEEVVSRFAALL
jgi:3-deoxy-7-phosphoheptulonate synthase